MCCTLLEAAAPSLRTAPAQELSLEQCGGVSRDSSSGGAVLREEAALPRTALPEELPLKWARRGGASKDSSSRGAVLRAKGTRREQNTKTLDALGSVEYGALSAASKSVSAKS